MRTAASNPCSFRKPEPASRQRPNSCRSRTLHDQNYNLPPPTIFQRPDTRYTRGFFAHYDVDNRLHQFADLMIMGWTTRWRQIAPSGLCFGSGTGPDFTVYTNCSQSPDDGPGDIIFCAGELSGDAM